MQEDFRALSAEMFDESDSGSDPSIRCASPQDDGSGIPSRLAEN
jgi:hypothetical protein